MLPLQVQTQSHVPLYIQIRDQLRAMVHTGELRPGDRIPASRELAHSLGVHRTTVANGQRGFTPAPPTLGNGALRWESLFADERGEEALNRIYPETSNGAISLVAARPAEEFFPIEELRSCVQAVLKDAGGAILQLGSTDGYEPLKRELLAQLNREGLRLKTEQLLVTAGALFGCADSHRGGGGRWN